MNSKKYLTITDLSRQFECFTEQKIRHMLKVNMDNIKSITLKIGRRIYFEENTFIKWVESHKLIGDNAPVKKPKKIRRNNR